MRRPAAQPASSIPRFLFSLNRCGTTTREPDLSGRANSRPGILLKNPACGPGGGAAGNRKPVRTTWGSMQLSPILGAFPHLRPYTANEIPMN